MIRLILVLVLLGGCSSELESDYNRQYLINNIGFGVNQDDSLVKNTYYYSDNTCSSPAIIAENVMLDLNTHIHSYDDFNLYSYDLGSRVSSNADLYRLRGVSCEFLYNSGFVSVIYLDVLNTPDFITYSSGVFYYY